MKNSDWKIYRTRFLVRARQLTEPLFFIDVLGREHRGVRGDYLIEFSGGVRRIMPRVFFEDVYVPMIEDQRTLSSKREWPVVEHRNPVSRRALVT